MGLQVEAVQADVLPGRGSTPAGLILLQLGQRQRPHRVHKHFLISVTANTQGGNIDGATLYTAGLAIFFFQCVVDKHVPINKAREAKRPSKHLSDD